jgi:hypothetical protein
LIDDDVSTISTSQIDWSGWMRARQCPVTHHPTLVDIRRTVGCPFNRSEFYWIGTIIAPFRSNVTTF